ncbi:hypothetical protein PuT2_02770 [Pusillimonas sp. T2]|uniref:copper resistance protein NlpE N-terminal domain-containing protein n=1 Tax=Pusillimonas sp. T2 TaxID=1548123 RepID=UPI000B9CBD90|nr:copper resistance protein NlpE N-terminal domain-containing protein [Pusillimonas sp. T2]OXR50801.1 hypothetical protein PuT2_02770 [Pusillimonas sp. T2]
MPALKKPTFRFGLLAVISAVALAGCAKQQSPGYYETGPESTLSDAQSQAQGRNGQRAPSQLQLGFGDTAEKPTAQPTESAPRAAAASIRPLLEPKTFLGTTPCLPEGQDCPATRITLTMAPDGEWRARTVQLGTTNPVTTFEQGCWVVVGTAPWRVLLETDTKATKARLTFQTDNILRIDAINDHRPTLDYHLTRQAEVDGITEMNARPKLNCRP